MARKPTQNKSVVVNVKGQTIRIPRGVSLSDGAKVVLTFPDEDDDAPRDTPGPEIFGEEIDPVLEKRLVAVGINEYRDPGISDLRGCVNDATAFCRKLNSEFGFAFDRDHFRFLTDDLATKANIIASLTWLVAETGPMDVGVFYYSGHGAQIPDQLPPDGDEADMLDEVIVPHDADKSAADVFATLIRDDEIAAILRGVNPDAHFVVVFDSCNSGTGTRPVQFPTPGAAIAAERSAAISNHAANLKALFASATASGLSGPHPLAGPNHLLLAAAHASQSSWEIGGQGVFTRHLLANMSPNKSYAQVMAAVSGLVDSEVRRTQRVSQVPQIEGPLQGYFMFGITI